jgi:hypothetical protein
MAYLVNLPAKTDKVRDGEVGYDFDSMGLKVVEVIHEEPDPRLFLTNADLKAAVTERAFAGNTNPRKRGKIDSSPRKDEQNWHPTQPY